MNHGDKIAVLLPSFAGGGAERALLNFVRAAAQLGYPADVLVATDDGPLRELVPSTVAIIDLGARRMFGALPALVRYLRMHRPRAMYSAMAHANVVALLARMLSGSSVRVVVREANVFLEGLESKPFGTRAVFWLARRLYPSAYGVIAVSDGIRDELIRLNPALREITRVVANPVVSDEMLIQAEDDPQHPWLGAGESVPVVLCVGRLRPQKDFETAIRAVAYVRKVRPVRLIILGEGSERAHLLELAHSVGLAADIDFPGFKMNPFAFMRRAGVFLLSSKHEGMPNVLIQALALGTPCVATDCKTGPREVLADGKYGALVPVGDAQSMGEAILRVLSGAPSHDAGKLYATEQFGILRAAESYLELAGLHKTQSAVESKSGEPL